MKKLVFIVEDDLTQQKMLQVHFEEALGSYAVRCFANPQDMLEHLEEKPFAVVLDHFFNDQTKTGLDYLELMRKKYSTIPIIYYTTLNDDTIKAKVMKSGAVQFILKDSASLVRLRTALDEIHEKKNKKSFLKGLFKK
jgi:FixJ family two-component response regulator